MTNNKEKIDLSVEKNIHTNLTFYSDSSGIPPVIRKWEMFANNFLNAILLSYSQNMKRKCVEGESRKRKCGKRKEKVTNENLSQNTTDTGNCSILKRDNDICSLYYQF